MYIIAIIATVTSAIAPMRILLSIDSMLYYLDRKIILRKLNLKCPYVLCATMSTYYESDCDSDCENFDERIEFKRDTVFSFLKNELDTRFPWLFLDVPYRWFESVLDGTIIVSHVNEFVSERNFSNKNFRRMTFEQFSATHSTELDVARDIALATTGVYDTTRLFDKLTFLFSN